MSDKNYTLAIRCKIPDNLHQLINLLWSEGSCRLVQNKCIRTTIQHLKDFHSLLHSNRNILNLCIRVNLHSVFLRKLYYSLSRLCLVEDYSLFRLNTKYNIFCYCKWLNKHEVLMHHTYSKLNCVLRACQYNLPAVNRNRTTCRSV